MGHTTDTFDILHVNYTILPGAIQVTVDYVEGSVHNRFRAKLQCPSKNISKTFSGSSGTIDEVPPNESCTLMITDYNAMHLRAADTTENVTVPATETHPTNSSNTTMNQPTPANGLLNCFSFTVLLPQEVFCSLGNDNIQLTLLVGIAAGIFIAVGAAVVAVVIVRACELLSSPCHICILITGCLTIIGIVKLGRSNKSRPRVNHIYIYIYINSNVTVLVRGNYPICSHEYEGV